MPSFNYSLVSVFTIDEDSKGSAEECQDATFNKIVSHEESEVHLWPGSCLGLTRLFLGCSVIFEFVRPIYVLDWDIMYLLSGFITVFDDFDAVFFDSFDGIISIIVNNFMSRCEK